MTQIDVRTSRRTEMIVITDQVQRAVTDSGVQSGLCYVQVPHTTAAVTINENADPDVPHDILHALDRLVPQNDPEYRHDEGNSAAHVKSSLFGASRIGRRSAAAVPRQELHRAALGPRLPPAQQEAHVPAPRGHLQV